MQDQPLQVGSSDLAYLSASLKRDEKSRLFITFFIPAGGQGNVVATRELPDVRKRFLSHIMTLPVLNYLGKMICVQ